MPSPPLVTRGNWELGAQAICVKAVKDLTLHLASLPLGISISTAKPMIENIMGSKLPDHLKLKIKEVINAKANSFDDAVAAPPNTTPPNTIFNFHRFLRNSDWATFRDPESTLYLKLCTGAQLLQAIGNPKLPETDVAKIVSLIMFVHAGGRNDSTVAEQLTQLQTFKTIMTSIANRTAVRSRIAAEPNELQINDPVRYGVAYGSEPPSTCQLSPMELALAYKGAHCRSTKKEATEKAAPARAPAPVSGLEMVATRPTGRRQDQQFAVMGQMWVRQQMLLMQQKQQNNSREGDTDGSIPRLTIFPPCSPERRVTVAGAVERAHTVDELATDAANPTNTTGDGQSLACKTASPGSVATVETPLQASPGSGTHAKKTIAEMTSAIQAKLKTNPSVEIKKKPSGKKKESHTKKTKKKANKTKKKANKAKATRMPAARTEKTKKALASSTAKAKGGKRLTANEIKKFTCPNVQSKHGPVHIGCCTVFCDVPRSSWRIKPEYGSRRTDNIAWAADGNTPRATWEQRVLKKVIEYNTQKK